MSNVQDIRGQLVRQSDSESLSQREDGTWQATCVFKTAWDGMFRVLPQRNKSKHPDFNFMTCVGVSVSKEKPGAAVVTAQYRGKIDGETEGQGGSYEPQSRPVISIQNGVSTEPIETHPDWNTIGTEANGAIFDTSSGADRFIGWEKGSDYEGIESYLVPSVTYRRTYVSTTEPTSIANLAKIEASPVDAPTPPTGRDWLKVGHTWDRSGDIWTITEEWRLSGPSGWNSDVYPS